MEALAIRVEDARESDLDFVKDSWRRSYRNSPRTVKWDDEPYAIFIAELMERLIAKSRVRVARPVDMPDVVIGWVCAEQMRDRFCVHYAVTKEMFRRQGVMTEILTSFEPEGELVFSSLRLPGSDYLKQIGFAHDPRAASNPKVRIRG